MEEFQINEVLNDSFNFSEIDDDILDPDFILPGNSGSQNDLLGVGILELSIDDYEEDLAIYVDTENIEGAASTSRIIDAEVIIDNEYEEENESRRKKEQGHQYVGEEIFLKHKE